MIKDIKFQELSQNFSHYIDLCNTEYRPYDASSYLYRLLLDRYSKKELRKTLNTSDFFELLYATLFSWDMNTRGAKLLNFEAFRNNLDKSKSDIIKLQDYKIDTLDKNQIDNEVLPILKRIFCNLKVSTNKTCIVSLSKTLHFMLPDLIMPIDRTYTMNFLYGNNKYSDTCEAEFKTFYEIFYFFYNITMEMKLDHTKLPEGRLNTSIPKVIDNAIIGFMKEHKTV